MESLESKLEKLSPDQRKEIEDFVDFLLSRSPATSCVETRQPPVPPVVNQVPPVFTSPEPEQFVAPASRDLSHSEEQPSQSSSGDWITRDYMDYGQFEQMSESDIQAMKKVKAKSAERDAREKSQQLLDWID